MRGAVGAPVRLVRGLPRPRLRLELDGAQRRVVEHRGGPLLVLAGPGTGKTATLVEAAAHRVEHDGLDPEEVLLLTFSRRAAAELRERLAARLARTVREPLARTFHSYAFGLLRREAVLRGEPSPRLLSGAEQDLVVRDLLRGEVEELGADYWPASVRPALGTRGFVQELRDLLQRCAERGVTPAALGRLGRERGRADWVAASAFARQYAGVTALRQPPSYDPAELVRAAVGLLRDDPRLLAGERAARRAVLVDEYQDSDPAQEELLGLLAGGGRDLVVVGDPDQSIYAFRGAEVAGIRRFPDRFPTASGRPAPVVALTTCRRSGPVLLRASRGVAARLGGSPGHRDLVSMPRPCGPGEVEVHLLRSAGQEAAYIAERLRRAHLLDGLPWASAAVLVRGAHALPVLRRALTSAGVPVAVRLEEVSLVDQPPVRALLDVLAVTAGRRALDADLATALVTGPLGGADPLALRRLRQELRRAEVAAGGSRGSSQLLVSALEQPGEMGSPAGRAVAPARRVAALLRAAADACAAAGATAEDVLWAVWQGSGLGPRWSAAALRGGAEGAAADRDLDAVVALFDAAARYVDRLPGAGLDGFLDHLAGQQLPADSLAPRAPGGDAVTLLTAHAAKGLEWDVVMVAGVQEGVWPDLRPRGSLLGSEALADLVAGREATPGARLSALLAEERRLFYVAVTRARRRLLVTAVRGEEAEPSRFLDELLPWPHDTDRPLTAVGRGLDLPALVAELRRAVCDRGVGPGVRRDAAAQLARLATAGVGGASPQAWYGLAELTDDTPVHPAGEVVRVSPSRVEAFERCGLRWLLESCAATTGATAGQAVGSLVHELAEQAVREGLRGEALLARFEQRWPGVDVGRGWSAAREHDRARQMVARLDEWLGRASARELVAVERDFEVPVGRALLAGRVDRLERDRDGRLVVVDLKTGRGRPSRPEVARHAQLGAYQVAVRAGAFPEGDEPGGASLLQLGDAAAARLAAEQHQPPPDATADPAWAEALVEEAAEGMAGARFPARVGSHCRRCPVRPACPAHDEGRQVVP